MGRIKTTFVKNVGKELMEKHTEVFSGDFENNKKALIPLVSFTSRKMRNLVAGYITSVKNAKPFVQMPRSEETNKESRLDRRMGGRRRSVGGRRRR